MMLIHKNNSNTLIIVLHEIYGINKHIKQVCKELSKRKYDIIVPNLLNDRIMFRYDQEQIAYSYFINKIGFEIAMKQIEEILYSVRSNYKKIYVLGYSIGATLAWLCSQTGLCDLVVGFYGSRIRENIAIVPQCPTLLFFPTEEKSFDVDDLIMQLSEINNISVKKLSGKHGFADQFSKNYNNKSLLIASKEILLFVKSVSA
ncbi:dienelactone hydrolase family protein [Pelosinus baikalensis]|uniref:Dienelactone hydrolase family protein n=1 Tax=Pelosinus baikalensis TaxID=2892015 RepID=A0ABS8HQG9_9FIRM|nr:dienelactone hydrolase family protein [Pelosinus baikalensis]MCC5465426.1 dienelactone hydrolase family protein [Pelosinus baikalensis]